MTQYIVLGRENGRVKWEYLGFTGDITQPEGAIPFVLKQKQKKYEEELENWEHFRVLPVANDEDGNALYYREDELELEEL